MHCCGVSDEENRSPLICRLKEYVKYFSYIRKCFVKYFEIRRNVLSLFITEESRKNHLTYL